MTRRIRWSLLAGASVLALCGCATTVQTSSGRDYLAARPDWLPPATAAGQPMSVDRAVFEAASAEPLLRFPARLGLARLEHGSLTSVPPAEADHWLALAKDLGPGFGEFVPISPLVAELAAGAERAGSPRAAIDRIRIGAARQHVDAVLVYEVRGSGNDSLTPLSVLDLTIVGAYLVPSRAVKGEAAADAMLVDVRNGYPYGTAASHAEESGLAPSFGSGSRSLAAERDAEAKAVGNLTGAVRTMLVRLKSELEDKELARLRAEHDARAAAAPGPAALPARRPARRSQSAT